MRLVTIGHYTFLVPSKAAAAQRSVPDAPTAGERGARADLESEAGRLRLAVGRLSRRLRRPGLGELSHSQLSALSTVTRYGPLRLGDLATREGVSASTLSRLVDGLVERGMATRVRDPDDARSSQVSATADGVAFLEDLRRNGTTVIHAALAALADRDRAAVLAALPALERLADRAESAGGDRLG